MKIFYLLIFLSLGGGAFWLAQTHPDLKDKAEGIIGLKTVRAFEVRYGVEQITEMHQKKILKEKGARVLNSSLKFYPYLLIEAKFTSKKKTKESLILWDLADGEMVLNADAWEKTHGFADCIHAHLLPHEFKIISTIARKGGNCERKDLLEKLTQDYPLLDTPLFEAWLRTCFKKNLLVDLGDHYRLHLQNPKLTRVPETKIKEKLLTRTYKQADRLERQYSRGEIEKMTRVAFGPQFSIRKSTEVYLPVYSIVVQLPGGGLKTHHFNALTGQILTTVLLYE